MITIDARWLHTSGIGTYLQNVIPGIIKKFPERNFTLLGNLKELQLLDCTKSSRVTLIAANSPMYSIREQFDYLRLIPSGTKLYFATHYNIPLFYRRTMLVMVYDVFHLAMPSLVGGLHKRLYARFMFSAVRRKAKSILTISDFTKTELIKYTGKGKQSILPIHLAVDETWYTETKDKSNHPKPYILYVGNIKPHKNLNALVSAFSLISNNIPHDLILVGKKEGFITGDSDVANQAQSLKERMFFTGYVDDQSLRNYFSHAEAFVFPSLYEGFGLPPLEAMAVNCPVLVSNAGPMPEVCGDGALFCDPYDIGDIAEKLLKILTDSKLRYSLKQKGYEQVRKFSWDSCINETCKIIHEMIEESSDTPQ